MPSKTLFGCLPQKGVDGDFKTYTNLEVIMQSIWVILNTPKGSRVWQPEFGCNVMAYIWDLLDDKTVNTMRTEIENALTRWEPRINLEEVNVTVSPYKQGTIDVSITFNYDGKDYTKNMSLSSTNASNLSVYDMHY